MTLCSCLFIVGQQSIACEWQKDLDRAKQFQSEGRTFKAIGTLEEVTQRCPTLARPYLELGSLWQSLGYSKRANDVWQYALTEYKLPDTVALKVKLRIIEAKLSTPSRWHHEARFSIMPWYDSVDELYLINKLSTQTRYAFLPKNLNDFALRLANDFNLSASQIIHESFDSPYYSVTVNDDVSAAIASITGVLGLQASISDDEIEWSIKGLLDHKSNKYGFSQAVEWAISDQNFRYATEANWYLRNVNLIGSIVAESDEKDWQLASIGIASYWNTFAGLYLGIDLLENGSTPQITASVTKTLNKNWHLSAFGDIANQDNALLWSAGSTLTLRVSSP
jgi:hypothetical protein